MKKYILKRLFMVIPLFFVISFSTFFLINLSPLDPAEVVLQARGTPEITNKLIAQTKEELGMNKPLMIRYYNWLIGCLHLDFGNSYVGGQKVWAKIGPAFLNTFKLTAASLVVIIVFSLLLGIICALNADKVVDKSVRGVSFFLTSMPSYLVASILISVFSIKLDLLPTSGMDSWKSYILPVIVTAISCVGIYFRNVRSSMLNNINENYVLYERACGLSENKVTMHILRNSLQVVVVIFCMDIPVILGGTVVVENVFAWPGIGRLCVQSILNRDLPVIQAYVVIISVAFILFNTLADIINAVMNPKLMEDI